MRRLGDNPLWVEAIIVFVLVMCVISLIEWLT